jgi:hypothetical protein
LAPGPLGRLVRWPVTPTGTGAGSSASPPYRRLRPRVFSAHGPGPQLQVHAPVWLGRYAPSFGRAPSDRTSLPSSSHFHNLARSCADPPRLALQRKSGPWVALLAHRLYYPVDMWPRSATYFALAEAKRVNLIRNAPPLASVDHTGLLRRPARCSVITQRAHAATAVLNDCLRFCMCGLVLCGSRVRASREEKMPTPIPAESHVAVCMPAASKDVI